MNKIFDPNTYEKFKLFSLSHIIAVIIVVVTWIIAIFIMKNLKSENAKRNVRYILAFLPLFFELAYILWNISYGLFTFAETLPLHMCGMFNILSAIMILTKKQLIFEAAYFVGVGGALQAIITPNMPQGFPHFKFIQLFAVHGVMILAVLYLIFVEGFIPRLKSIPKVILIVNVYIFTVYIINLLLGGNYMFLMGPSPNPSLIDTFIDIFGQPPLHIIGLEIVGILNIFVFSIPLIIRKIIVKNRKGKLSNETI